MTTIVSVVALALALLAFAYAWRLHKELDHARSRLDRYNRSIFAAEEAIRSLQQQVSDTSALLRLQVTTANGSLAFTPETSVRIAQMAHPRVQQTLGPLLGGGCESCAGDPDMTLAQLSQTLGVDTKELIRRLNHVVAGRPENDGDALMSLKAPNIRLELEM